MQFLVLCVKKVINYKQLNTTLSPGETPKMFLHLNVWHTIEKVSQVHKHHKSLTKKLFFSVMMPAPRLLCLLTLMVNFPFVWLRNKHSQTGRAWKGIGVLSFSFLPVSNQLLSGLCESSERRETWHSLHNAGYIYIQLQVRTCIETHSHRGFKH